MQQHKQTSCEFAAKDSESDFRKNGYILSKFTIHIYQGIWFSGIMLASGARGPEFDSRNPPTTVGSTTCCAFLYFLVDSMILFHQTMPWSTASWASPHFSTDFVLITMFFSTWNPHRTLPVRHFLALYRVRVDSESRPRLSPGLRLSHCGQGLSS
jgi:hypothetical protein